MSNDNHNEINLEQSNITLTIPNRDTFISEHTICPKEVLQKTYKDKMGDYINYCGSSKKVKNVQITDEFIYVELE